MTIPFVKQINLCEYLSCFDIPISYVTIWDTFWACSEYRVPHRQCISKNFWEIACFVFSCINTQVWTDLRYIDYMYMLYGNKLSCIILSSHAREGGEKTPGKNFL